MRLNSKVTWGLSWAGLALVLAVPSADFLTGALGGTGKTAVLTSDVDAVKAAKPAEPAAPQPVKTASVTTTKTPNGVIITPAGATPPADPVDKFLQAGKPLPDYISDSGKTPAKTVAPPGETQVAAIDPTPVAPTPFPAWARPSWTPAPAKPAMVVAPEPTVVVDETTMTGSIAAPGPTPPSPIVDDTANWQDESLRDYLERRGILEGGGESSATVTERSTDYDPDGFYLNEGPNGARETRRQRILRLLEESGNDPDSITLF
jgi:hypothetical protein